MYHLHNSCIYNNTVQHMYIHISAYICFCVRTSAVFLESLYMNPAPTSLNCIVMDRVCSFKTIHITILTTQDFWYGILFGEHKITGQKQRKCKILKLQCPRDYPCTILTLRRLMSYIYIYIYMEHPFLMFPDHTQRNSTVGRTPLDE